MFSIGDKIKCNCGESCPLSGTIIKINFEEKKYSVKLNDSRYSFSLGFNECVLEEAVKKKSFNLPGKELLCIKPS